MSSASSHQVIPCAMWEGWVTTTPPSSPSSFHRTVHMTKKVLLTNIIHNDKFFFGSEILHNMYQIEAFTTCT